MSREHLSARFAAAGRSVQRPALPVDGVVQIGCIFVDFTSTCSISYCKRFVFLRSVFSSANWGFRVQLLAAYMFSIAMLSS